MKNKKFPLILRFMGFIMYLQPLFTQAADLTNQELIGEWNYIGYIYLDQTYIKPNPDLNVNFQFMDQNRLLITWTRTLDKVFCQSLSHYNTENDILTQEVYLLNEANSFECSKDPDMQLGRKTAVPIQIENNYLKLKLNLGENDLIYILQKF